MSLPVIKANQGDYGSKERNDVSSRQRAEEDEPVAGGASPVRLSQFLPRPCPVHSSPGASPARGIISNSELREVRRAWPHLPTPWPYGQPPSLAPGPLTRPSPPAHISSPRASEQWLFLFFQVSDHMSPPQVTPTISIQKSSLLSPCPSTHPAGLHSDFYNAR